MAWDIDAWLDEAQPPTRAVKLYGRGDLVAKLQELQAAAEAHERYAQASAAVVDDRLAGGGARDDACRAEAALLVEQLEASARTFTVRGLLDHEQRALVDQATREVDGKKTVDEAAVELLIAELVVLDPPLTAARAEQLRARIGQAQWDALFRAISEASGETIDVPLSRLGLGTGQDS